MFEVNLLEIELAELTAAIREGAAAIVKAWDVLGKVGARLRLDWEPDADRRSATDIMEFFASNMTTPENITEAAVREAFSHSEDWTEGSAS